MDLLLEKLFESVPKVRLLRFFMRNPEEFPVFDDIVSRSQLRARAVRTELNKLLKLGVVKTKIATVRREVIKKSRSRKKAPKVIVSTKRTQVFYTNNDFELLNELRNLVAKSSISSRKKLLSQAKHLGNVKLVILSGIFINNENSRTDLLVVGDGIRKSKMETFLAKVESELGKSLRYTLMDTKEFKYRLDMYDRFLRDILEYPHEKLINKLHV